MFSYKKTRMQKLTKGYLAKRSSFLERKGDRRTSGDSWFLYVWIWESRRMLHMPPWFIKNFRFPTQISILITQICLFWWKVESTMWIRRNDGLCCFSIFIKEAIRSIHPLCSQRSTPTCLLMLRHRPKFRRNLPTQELQGNSCQPWALLIIGSSMCE